MAALQPIIVGKGRVDESNIWSHIEMAKLLIFNGGASKIVEFITVYRLYLRMRIREEVGVEKQIQ